MRSRAKKRCDLRQAVHPGFGEKSEVEGTAVPGETKRPARQGWLWRRLEARVSLKEKTLLAKKNKGTLVYKLCDARESQ